MAKKIDRRQFLGTAAQVSCGCVMATSLTGCAALARRPDQEVEATVVEGDTMAAVSIATAYCGIYCAACTRYLAGLENPEEGCPGCNQGEVGYPCQIKPCAEGSDLNACGECAQFPCEKLTEFFGTDRDYAVVGEKNSYRIAEIGYIAWLEEQDQRWTCNECGGSFTFQDETCPKCSVDIYSLAEEAAAYRDSRAD